MAEKGKLSPRASMLLSFGLALASGFKHYSEQERVTETIRTLDATSTRAVKIKYLNSLSIEEFNVFMNVPPEKQEHENAKAFAVRMALRKVMKLSRNYHPSCTYCNKPIYMTEKHFQESKRPFIVAHDTCFRNKMAEIKQTLKDKHLIKEIETDEVNRIISETDGKNDHK